MKDISILVEHTGDNFFAYTSELGGISVHGADYEAIKHALDEQIGARLRRGEGDTSYSGGYSLKFEVDVQSVFKFLPEVNISSLARHTDMSPGLLRQYTSGAKKASENQAGKVDKALHSLADKIHSVKVRKVTEPSMRQKFIRSLGMNISVVVATEEHVKYASRICHVMSEAAKQRGTGIAKRSPEYIETKMREGKAVIALDGEELAGFCYIESWEHNKFVANSGLIVAPDYRKTGLARKIKRRVLELSREKYPEAKIFGITTSLAVMKINSDLGYKPVTFSELTDDENFWKGCQGCVNYDILQRTERKHCLCTGMLYTGGKPEVPTEIQKKSRWERFQQLLKRREKRSNPQPQ